MHAKSPSGEYDLPADRNLDELQFAVGLSLRQRVQTLTNFVVGFA